MCRWPNCDGGENALQEILSLGALFLLTSKVVTPQGEGPCSQSPTPQRAHHGTEGGTIKGVKVRRVDKQIRETDSHSLMCRGEAQTWRSRASGRLSREVEGQRGQDREQASVTFGADRLCCPSHSLHLPLFPIIPSALISSSFPAPACASESSASSPLHPVNGVPLLSEETSPSLGWIKI